MPGAAPSTGLHGRDRSGADQNGWQKAPIFQKRFTIIQDIPKIPKRSKRQKCPKIAERPKRQKISMPLETAAPLVVGTRSLGNFARVFRLLFRLHN